MNGLGMFLLSCCSICFLGAAAMCDGNGGPRWVRNVLISLGVVHLLPGLVAAWVLALTGGPQ